MIVQNRTTNVTIWVLSKCRFFNNPNQNYLQLHTHVVLHKVLYVSDLYSTILSKNKLKLKYCMKSSLTAQ